MTRHIPVIARTAQTRAAERLQISVRNPETTDGLHSYLSNSGIPTRRLREASALCERASALLLFPDEYGDKEVRATLRELRAAHPRLLLLLVTALPPRVRRACEPDTRSVAPVVLPKPAFGWSFAGRHPRALTLTALVAS